MGRQNTSDTRALSLYIYMFIVNRILSAISNPTELWSTDSSVSQISKNKSGSRYTKDMVHLRGCYRATEIKDKEMPGSG